jgi:hypothetical protein
MKLLRLLCLSLVASVAYVAHAQVPFGPFVSPTQERFDALAPGGYAGFAGFGGAGVLTRIGAGGALFVNNNPGILPSLTFPNAMFGRGVNVRIAFAQRRKRFGGYFRVPFAGVPVNMAMYRFYQGAVLVAVTIAPVNNAGYLWRGWDLGAIGGFDRVEIFGNGGIPGYVGMDNLVVW